MTGFIVKQLDWKFWPNGFPPFWAGSIATGSGYYCVEETRDEDEPDEAPVFSVTNIFHQHIGSKRTLEEAKALAQSHFDSFARGLVSVAK